MTVHGVTRTQTHVDLVRWPSEQWRRTRLQRDGLPRLLMVEPNESAPLVTDCVEDWIRLPATQADVSARCEALLVRTGLHATAGPTLDDDGVLRVGERWVSLPPVEARLTSALLDRLGAVVSREQLARSGWPDGAPGRNALDVHVVRLRRRLAQVDMAIRTVRSRGYLLEMGHRSSQPAEQAG